MIGYALTSLDVALHLKVNMYLLYKVAYNGDKPKKEINSVYQFCFCLHSRIFGQMWFSFFGCKMW